ncbi:class I SAM-dependent methyltransferase [Pontiella agarivorans]|uniref:Class I SAM-dependent methyltransferase n=1 Tax=Pontiella agarivorans TaxID=3038953 RepID=A0ABU5N1T1_9BACT|nr:class I SAM-dependent methyltransferase [Pontiella agarivorans]MDZ8120414.1 class I SAM-dependent methyltransferase [Pontiella agarivorans]
MKILNKKLQEALEQGGKIKLDLGCGQGPVEGFFAVDHLEMDGVDVVADLNEPLDLLPDNSVDEIYSRHCFEHIDNFLPLMKEIHRVVKPGGKIEIIVPHYSNVLAYSDPTHVRFFGLYTMYYFVSPEHQPKKRKVPSFYSDIRFQIHRIKIEFYRYTFFERLSVSLIKRLVNLSFGNQFRYERRWSSLFHASQIRYLMTPDK